MDRNAIEVKLEDGYLSNKCPEGTRIDAVSVDGVVFSKESDECIVDSDSVYWSCRSCGYTGRGEEFRGAPICPNCGRIVARIVPE